MAMRPTFRSGATPSSRPRQAAVVQPVYEDFRPIAESQQDEGSNFLLTIYLPGFQKEHLRVSTEGRNILRAKGQRLVAGNKWSRFQEDYPLPEGCSLGGVHAKFEGGILTITVPRKREAKDASKEAAKATEDIPKRSPKTQEDLSSQRQPRSPKASEGKTHQKVADDNSGSIASPSVNVSEKGRDGNIRETRPDPNMLSETPKKSPNENREKSKEESDYLERPQKEEKRALRPTDYIMETSEESKANKTEGGSAFEDFMTPKAGKPEKSKDERDYPMGARIKEKIPDQIPNIMRKATEISEQESDRQKSARKIKKIPDQVENIRRETTEKPKPQKGKVNIEPKAKKTTTAAGSSSTDYGLANYKQAVKNLLELNEEGQLLVNVGAAVLVIVAFGAYLSYTIQDKLHDI